MREEAAGASVGSKGDAMTPLSHVQLTRDDKILVLLGLAAVISFLADALGWFRTGLSFNR